jgi:hypothetical protein
MMVDRLPPSVIPPLVGIALNGRERRKVLGQHAPRATALGNGEDRVHHSPKIRGARTAAAVFRREKRRDDGPFFVGRVACITQVLSPILGSSDFSPHHLCRNATESQVTEIT